MDDVGDVALDVVVVVVVIVVVFDVPAKCMTHDHHFQARLTIDEVMLILNATGHSIESEE